MLVGTRLLIALLVPLAALQSVAIRAQEPPVEKAATGPITERVEEGGATVEVDQRWSHTGLLRARDLTPLGLYRLDMLPTHTADAEPGTWTFELQFAYQNTFVMSDNVRDYLEARGSRRQQIRAEDAAAILALPGDAYYVDGEVGYADLIVQRRLNEYWSAFATVPHSTYG